MALPSLHAKGTSRMFSGFMSRWITCQWNRVRLRRVILASSMKILRGYTRIKIHKHLDTNIRTYVKSHHIASHELSLHYIIYLILYYIYVQLFAYIGIWYRKIMYMHRRSPMISPDYGWCFPCPRPCRVDDANSPRPHTLDTGCGFFCRNKYGKIGKQWKT